jgi:hypothetical protein
MVTGLLKRERNASYVITPMTICLTAGVVQIKFDQFRKVLREDGQPTIFTQGHGDPG